MDKFISMWKVRELADKVLSSDYAIGCHHMVDFSDPDWVSINGNRMVDADYLLRWVLALTNEHQKDCSLPNFTLVGEKFVCMVSTLFLKCRSCDKTFMGKTENPNEQAQIRRSIVWSVVSSGGTHAHAEEMFAYMGSPFMCFKSFMKTEHEMYDSLAVASQKSMDKAIQEEKANAVDFDENGVPCTTTYLDGSWPMRSYGGRYSSRSGAAVMIGGATQKIIYGDTKNTFCIKCYVDHKNGKEENHKCFRNFDGSAGAIEPAILLEGFDNIFTHGLKARIVVGDGDSSVFDQLKNKCSYGEELEKANCKNHTIKNLKKHLHTIAGKNQNDLARSALRSNIERICAGVHAAIIHCAENGATDVEGLRNDIRNTINHVFGTHENCRNYFCNNENDSTGMDILKSDETVYNAVCCLLENVASEADRLKRALSTNYAENFMSVIVKFTVGKRLNLCGRGSYSLRVLIAICQYNDGFGWSKDCFSDFVRRGCSSAYLHYVQKRDRKNEQTKKLKNDESFHRGCTKHYQVERDYGPNIPAVISNAEKMNIIMQKKLEYEIDHDLETTEATILTLSRMSKGRIITKNISDIVKTRKKDKLSEKADTCSSLAHNERSFRKIYYVSSFAKNHLSNVCNQQFTGPALRVRKELPFICGIISGVSTDGQIIFLTKMIELHQKKKIYASIMAAATELPNLGVRIKNGAAEADGNSIIEAQCCMFLFEAKQCIIMFVNARNYNDNLIVRIDYEEGFFNQKVKPELTAFIDEYYVINIVNKNIMPRKCINN